MFCCQPVKPECCHFHDTEGVFESCVGGSWIYQLRQCKLANMPESLEKGMVYNLSFIPREVNKAMDRAPYPVKGFVRVR